MRITIKKWDILIIGVLLIISFLPYQCMEKLLGDNLKNTYAYITLSGEVYKEIPLAGQVNCKRIEIESKYGKNTIVVENESIAIIDSDCPDHICEEFGFKNKVGDIIVCLPHQLYIEIKGDTDGSSQEDIRKEDAKQEDATVY